MPTALEPIAEIHIGPDTTDEQIEEWGRILRGSDRPLVTIRDLKILDGHGDIVPLILNPPQRKIMMKLGIDPDDPSPNIHNLMLRKRILKARREGITTVLMALFFLDAYNNSERLSVSVAHDKESSEAIFAMIHRFYIHLPPEKQRRATRANTREYYWPDINSRMLAATSGTPNLLSGATVHNLHCSERAKWAGTARDIALLDASVKTAARWGNIIEETTAYGLNHFYTAWKDSVGRLDVYDPIFLPWHADPRNVATVPPDMVPTDKEYDRMEAHGFDLSQLAWYREQAKESKDLMVQEYPETADEAFLTSGNPRFNRTYLKQLMDAIGTEQAYNPGWEPKLVETPDDSAWTGVVTTFVHPEPGHSYVIVADPAKGLTPGGDPDYSVAHIFDLETCEQVCHYRGYMTVYDMATDLYTLGRMYGDGRKAALIVIETPGPGDAVLSHLVNAETHYPNLYSYWDDDAQLGTGIQKRYGLPMGATTRPESINKADAMIHEAARGDRGHIRLRHPNTIDECMRFVKKRLGECEAESGAHDDEVSCVRFLAMIWAQCTTRGKQAIRTLRLNEPITATGSENAGVPAGSFGGFGF